MSFRITPIDGWGFAETVDGKLAGTFDAKITRSGVEFAPGVIGWKGKALNGKYAGCYLQITPRHVDWSGVIVLSVFPDQECRDYLYSGMADTEGLKPSWF